MSGHRGNQKVPPKKKPLSHGWIVVTSKTYPDRVYFYNTVTKCSTWNNPCESLSDREYTGTSSGSSSPVTKKSEKSRLKKQKKNFFFQSPDRNRNICINNEIEDYDEEQDQYFDNVHFNSANFSCPNIISPSSSPESDSSGNISDSDRNSGMLLENNKKQLWVHFVSRPEKTKAKKSVALCDLDEPSTSGNLVMEQTSERGRKKEKFSLKDSGKSFFNTDSFNESRDKDINGFRRKKLSKKPDNKKSISEKGLKKLSFKRTDKTPAQTRLLKLRKQNAEKLKELASKVPDFVIPKNNGIDSDVKKDKNSNSFDVDKQTRDDNFSEAYLRRIELLSNNQDSGNHSEGDYVEEMDWEPSNVESDVKNINVLRQQLGRTNEISSEIFFGLNSDHLLTLPQKNTLILVLDTNIFVSCLDFVKELRDAKIRDFGYPVIYVPWRVLQELDHLKDTKIDKVERHIHANVRRAILYLNENFKSRHPRVFGQSFEDFAKMVDVEAFAPDDEILQTCLHFQKQNADKNLMLLTNDKNLESKALISGVKAYSKDRFMKEYLNSQSSSSTTKNTQNPSSNDEARLDKYLCEVKAVLKQFLPVFVETELKIAFEGDWIKLAFKKPPWTLQDALDTLLKHWRSVFFLIFPRETHSEAERLYERLFKREPAATEDIVEIIRTIQRLLTSIKRHQKKKRPYTNLIPSTITKLSKLLQAVMPNHTPQDFDEQAPTSSLPSVSPNDSTESRQTSEGSFDDVTKVKILFKDLWDSLRSFCCSISDVIHSSGADNFAVLQEIKLKVIQILNEVGELVMTVEKIFEMNVCDISESHPLIIHFSNFLIRVYPAMAPDLRDELPRCLAAFFTDFEGRSLLSCSLNDFREFIQDLSKATEYFSTQVPY